MFKLTTKYHVSNLYKYYLSLYVSQIWPDFFFFLYNVKDTFSPPLE